MTRDHEHEDRGILGRLRRRRGQAPSTPATNLFTARAEPASSPVPPPPEPPPERLFDGVDRWDEPQESAEDEPPLFSEAELDATVEADATVAPPPPAPTPPPPTPPTVPHLGSDLDYPPTDPTAELPPAPHDPPAAPSGPIDGPSVLDAPPPPDAPLFGPSSEPATSDFFVSAATPTSEPAPDASVDREAADLADLTDELHRYAAEDALDEPEDTGLWAHLAEPYARPQDDARHDASPESAGPLADNLFVHPPKPTPPPAHLTDEDLAEPAPEPADDHAASWLYETGPGAPAHEPDVAETEPAFTEPEVAPEPEALDEPDEPAAVAPVWRDDETPLDHDLAAPASVFGTEDEAAPLMDQVAREFGDPRETLHRMVEGDLDDLPAAASAPPAPPSLDEPPVPVSDEAVAPPPPVVDDEGFLPAPAEPAAHADDDLLFAGPPPAPEPVEPEPDEPEVRTPEPEPAATEQAAPAAEVEPQPAHQADADPEPEHRTSPEWAEASVPIPLSVEPATHGPSTIRVHDERLENRPGPIKMSPSEAVALAQDGPQALKKKRPKSR